MTTTMRPFLMFQGGVAEEAIAFWLSLFPDGELVEMVRYGPGDQGPEGTVFKARLRIAGQELRCFDSPVAHAFTFTPAISLFVECGSEAEIDRLAAGLGAGGGVLMPPGDYGFSRKFAWLNDRFGVSWQLNWA
jgi:predicted 3-demethylubiquinone-9 3-methyltransferase (glyoxalase superfamily)